MTHPDPLSVVELFAGIGGFGLAFERRGFHVTDQVEIDPYCLAVLAKNFPNARRHTDVRLCGRETLPLSPTVLCGGFPCQPHSLAGKRKGAKDSRDLWVEFARLIGELRPRWVVAENVPAIRTSDGGWYFWRVLADLAACGYDAEWDCVPACSVGAPHARRRLFVVAYTNGELGAPWIRDKQQLQKRAVLSFNPSALPAFDKSVWLEGSSKFYRVVDGVPNRLDRLRACGNSLVPQVAEVIAQRILEIELGL